MSAQGYSLDCEVGNESKEPEYELSGGHVNVARSHIYQQNPAYNVVTAEAGRGAAKHPPVYQEVLANALPTNPVQMVMSSTPNLVSTIFMPGGLCCSF